MTWPKGANERLLWDKPHSLLPDDNLAEAMLIYTQGLMGRLRSTPVANLCSAVQSLCVKQHSVDPSNSLSKPQTTQCAGFKDYFKTLATRRRHRPPVQ
jgi:hypothetical protein